MNGMVRKSLNANLFNTYKFKKKNQVSSTNVFILKIFMDIN